MAVTNEKSTQITNIEKKPVVFLKPDDWHGNMRIFRFNFTQGAAAGDAGSTQQLIKLPAGRWRVMLNLSIIVNTAFGTSRTLDLGWQAYTGNDGVAVVADPNGLDAAQSVVAAGIFSPIGTLLLDETRLFDSRDGVTIESSVQGGTIPAAAKLDGYIIAVSD